MGACPVCARLRSRDARGVVLDVLGVLEIVVGAVAGLRGPGIATPAGHRHRRQVKLPSARGHRFLADLSFSHSPQCAQV
eukprot:COSAG02_NODE_34330_length_485_cov_2.323834_1_plen_79_part_00